MTIGDLLIRVLADMKDFQADTVKEAEKTGDKAGAALSKSLGASLKTVGIKAIGTGLAAAFGIAAKGALELENATARYRAETGATAEAADVMGKAINRIAGSERLSLEAVTDIAIRVKNDMGATGQAAVDLTKRFAQFARVTRQDGAESVKAFDDILDSWGLTADKTGEIMDKLIVSQHKFGGDLNETEATLAQIAPAMKAANFSIDDGIALLGLFGSKGLDATSASAAFAKALTKVKSPEELQKLIKDIEHTQDPFLRASKAADLFGARAGAKLANALGEANLDDYKISVDESAGALQNAADVIDNTFSGKVQKAISEATASLREFGASFGPALSGAAGLASLFATAGGGSLLKPLIKGLVGFPALLKKTVIGGIMSLIVPANAAGVLVGEAQATGMAEGMQSSKAMGVAKTALGGIGKVWGSLLGKAFVLGALAVIGVELWDQLQKMAAANTAQQNDIGKSVGNEIGQGAIEGLQQSKAALEKGISDLDPYIWIFGSASEAGRAQQELKRQLGLVNDAIANAGRERLALERRTGEEGGKALADGLVAGTEKGLTVGFGKTSAKLLASATVAFGTTLPERMKLYGGKTVEAWIQGITDAKNKVKGGFDDLLNLQKTSMTRQQEMAYTIGVLTSKALASGLRDGRPDVRARAEQVQRDALERLGQLARGGKKVGADSMKAIADGLKSKNADVRAAAQNAKTIIENNVKPKPHAADSAFTILGGNAARSFKNGFGTPTLHANVVLANSGYKGGARAEGGPVIAGQPYIVGEKRPELFVPKTDGMVYPSVPSSVAAPGGNSFNITVHAGNDVSPLAARRFGQAVLDVVADGLREQTARSA